MLWLPCLLCAHPEEEPSYVPRNPHKSVYALASMLTQMADESEEVQAVTVFV